MNYHDYKVKLIVGFRRDQEHTISADEAHKAYFLFMHPEQRGVFNNGLAIKGDQIEEIVPDYQNTMGWNPTHVLDSDDWNDIRKQGIDVRLQRALMTAKDVAQLGDPKDLNVSLTDLVMQKYPQLEKPGSIHTTGGMRRIGDILHD